LLFRGMLDVSPGSLGAPTKAMSVS